MRVAVLAVVVLALAGGAAASTPGANVALVFAQQLSAPERTNTTPNRYVCAAAPDGSSPRKVTAMASRSVDPDVSPLGGDVVYVSALAGPLGTLERVPAGGGPAISMGAPYAWPAWSKDGTRIFVSGSQGAGSGGNQDLFVVAPDGSSATPFVTSTRREAMATTGGGWVAFIRADPARPLGSGGELWMVREDGVALRQLRPGDDASDPDLSGDGRRVVYAAADGIHLLTVEPVFQDSGSLTRGTDPEFSPDGTRIAFVRDGDIWTMSASGGEQANVTHSPIIETDPTWQAAGAPAGSPEPCAIVGTEGDDVLVGSPYADWVYDLGGNDIVRTLEGDDLVFDGAGADRYELGDGVDVVVFSDGGNTVDAGPGDDRITGSNQADRILGGDGNDTIWGMSGPDILFGGPGNDRIEGNRGDDSLDGGLGDDVLYGGLISGSPQFYDGYDLLVGRGGNDRLAGGWQKDRLFGGPGNDRLRGGPHADHLAGEAGADDVAGEGGDDLVLARDGTRDRASGGPGFDRARLDRIDRRGGIERLLR
jgi:Ca2+-binding RTX toxin-like protein